jgi:hypothetical protein
MPAYIGQSSRSFSKRVYEMKAAYLLLVLAVVLSSLLASGQDWQDCKPDGSSSFKKLKESVRRVATTSTYTGWDDKAFSRSGDLASLAVLQSLSEAEMASPETLKGVLVILRTAFACPHRCVNAIGDREPKVTLLLLEHLHSRAGRKARSSIDETKRFVLQQARSGD